MGDLSLHYARKECVLHAQLNHDNVVKLYDYTESEKDLVLFMEYCNSANYFDEKIVEVSSLHYLGYASYAHTSHKRYASIWSYT